MNKPQGRWQALVRNALAALTLIASLVPSLAQSDTRAEAAIREALLTWTKDFNARDTQKVCDLFAPDLRYDFRGRPERGFDDICTLLRRSLSDPAKRYVYSLDIKEIIVSGDLAVVRLVWTLKVSAVGTQGETVSEEPGMDIFRRQADGRWKITRYIAYEN
jgi:uncharacterized protein (TIGR02246 family)